MAAAVKLSGIDQVAVGQEDRTAAAVGANGGSEAGQDVGAVKIVGDLAKALGLALGAEIAAGQVKALQSGIGPGIDAGGQPQFKGIRHPGNGQ